MRRKLLALLPVLALANEGKFFVDKFALLFSVTGGLYKVVVEREHAQSDTNALDHAALDLRQILSLDWL